MCKVRIHWDSKLFLSKTTFLKSSFNKAFSDLLSAGLVIISFLVIISWEPLQMLNYIQTKKWCLGIGFLGLNIISITFFKRSYNNSILSSWMRAKQSNYQNPFKCLTRFYSEVILRVSVPWTKHYFFQKQHFSKVALSSQFWSF